MDSFEKMVEISIGCSFMRRSNRPDRGYRTSFDLRKYYRLGIGIMLFAIIFHFCSLGMEGVTLFMGTIGLLLVIAHLFAKPE